MKKVIILVLVLLPFVLTSKILSEEKEIMVQDGVSISYQIEGQEEPALVFIHGWSCDKTYWQNQLEHFSKMYTVLAVDLAGHGDSGVNRQIWTIPTFGKDVGQVIKEEKVSKVILIGHSMGGGVILEAARLLGDCVVGIVGVDTYQNVEISLAQDQVEGFLAPFKANFTAMTTQFVRNMFPGTADTMLVRRIVEDMSSAPAEVGVATLRAGFSYSPLETIKEIHAPVVAINADHFPSDIETARKHFSSFDLKLMKGCGHFVMIEDPEEFNRLLEEAILSFL